MNPFTTQCHCGSVRARFKLENSVVWKCDCSDCYMRQNHHIILPRDCLEILSDENTTLYQWGTMTAVRKFCRTCGVLPWYYPRSNPDGVGVNIYCVDWTQGGTAEPPKLDYREFDGRNYEQSMAAMNEGRTEIRISDLSKRS